MSSLTSLELCAGGGGQAIGLELAGFRHVGLVELDPAACATLRRNRPFWNVIQDDVRVVDGSRFRGVDLVAGGVPCPPFSRAGKRLGASDDRDLFPALIEIVRNAAPRAVMIENVPGILDPMFDDYRAAVLRKLDALGYVPAGWRVLNACQFGVPQLRPRAILVAFDKRRPYTFKWPVGGALLSKVGPVLAAAMGSCGWQGVKEWEPRANKVAPTIVGGSKKHGGPDLGPTRAKRAWAELGVDGLGIADAPPSPEFKGLPRLTIRMVATLQGFPQQWEFLGGKTAAYRQVGNAFPPPVGEAMGREIAATLHGRRGNGRPVKDGVAYQLALDTASRVEDSAVVA